MGCRRRDTSTTARPGLIVMAVANMNVMAPDETDADFLPFSPLAEQDEHGEFVPRLATSWDRSADNLEWTYHLRRDVRWHDGQPFTAHDVKFTCDLLNHRDVHQYRFDSVTVVDEHTVTIRVAHWQENAYQADIVIYPRHLLQDLMPKQFMSWDFWTHPVGTGPFRFVRSVPDTLIEFEANPEYFRGKPKIPHLILKVVGSGAVTELLSGQVDTTLGGDSSQIQRVLADPRFRVYYRVDRSPWAIFWKSDDPLLHDPSVRRALTLAIDRQECVGILNLPRDLQPSDGVFLWGCAGCTIGPGWNSGELPKPLPFDPGEADKLLNAAGWSGRDANGIRVRAGHPFRFTALVPNDRDRARLAVVVQSQLRRVGVEMSLESMDVGVVNQRLRGGEFVALFGSYRRTAGFQKGAFGRGNHSGYSNPEAFRLIDAALSAKNEDELIQTFRELTTVFRSDLPVTVLAPKVTLCFAHRRLRGLSAARPHPDRYMEDLWIDNRSPT